MDLFIFGLGYSARATAKMVLDRNPASTVQGTVRDAAEVLPKSALSAHLFGTNELLRGLSEATHVLISIPPDKHSNPTLIRYGDPTLVRYNGALNAMKYLRWIGYYSTVGVYGDFAGAWVDEAAETQPVNQRSQIRISVEQLWRDYAEKRGLPLCVLRLAGIYGPGRSAFDKLRDGTAKRIVKPGQVFNRIHVADIARVTALAAERRLSGTFNLADDEPATPQEVVSYASGLLGISPPREVAFETAAMTPMARSFYADNKRVSNAAIKRALGIELLYPNYRDGLAAILKDETQ
jgi:nucleoside-diphosphate-sugar epimerase